MIVEPSRESRQGQPAGKNPVRSRWQYLIILAVLLSMGLHGSLLASSDRQLIEGVVKSGDEPIGYAQVTLYEAWQGHGRPRILARTTGDRHGKFSLAYHAPRHENPVLYVIADGTGAHSKARPASASKKPRRPPRSRAVRLATVLGDGASIEHVVINERTTVATAYAMAQFIDGNRIGGFFPGLQNAAATVRNLVDLETGRVGTVLDSSPNGDETSTRATFNSLANMLAACARDQKTCVDLFRAAKPPRGRSPRNTLDAMINIAHYPGKSEANVGALLELAQIETLYQPALGADAISEGKINSWVLAVRYIGDLPDGQGIDGPGNVAFDSLGNAWVNTNYQYSAEREPDTVLCGGTKVIKLTPTGGNAPGAPFGGPNDEQNSGENAGGLYGAGFGIALDPDENVWIPSFGFQGKNCPNDLESLFVSTAKFAPDGTTLSKPDGDPSNNIPGGFGSQDQAKANMLGPQSVVSDKKGNIWIGNCANDSITLFPKGDPLAVKNFPDVGIEKPFGLAIGANGHLWIAANGNSSVVELDHAGKPIGSPITSGITRPMGIASDSKGNLWVANAGLPSPPCPLPSPSNASEFEDPSDEIGVDGLGNRTTSVTLIMPHGKHGATRKVVAFPRTDNLRTGFRWPWGIAVDGDDNVWVANFAGQRVMPICGVKQRNCLPRAKTGDALALQDGYFSDALERVTAVQVDPSGNLWAANNWILDAFTTQSNPGGYHMVVFIGLAAPIKTPLIGPPEQLGPSKHDHHSADYQQR